MAKRVTVYDIAERVGLSASTVSRVLNNSILISDEKKRLILSTAEELGYTKRPIRKHRGRAILNIALFLPHLEEGHLHLFYEMTGMLNTIRSSFDDTRVNIITDVVDRSHEHLGSKKVGGLDGVLFAFCSPASESVEMMEKLEVPFVLLNRRPEKFNYIDCDHRLGTQRLTRKILEVRKTGSPCFLDFPPIRAISEQRRLGFLDACAEAGLRNGPDRIVAVKRFSDLDRILSEILDHYDACVAFNDVLAVYLYQLALARGVRIPEQLGLSGFDASPVRKLISPVLTTMRMPIDEMISEAARWLYGRIIERNEDTLALTLKSELIRGETI